jgi:hypothetical protein
MTARLHLNSQDPYHVKAKAAIIQYEIQLPPVIDWKLVYANDDQCTWTLSDGRNTLKIDFPDETGHCVSSDPDIRNGKLTFNFYPDEDNSITIPYVIKL